MIKKIGFLVFLLALAGCNTGDKSPNVAIVDLDEVASVTGRDTLIQSRVQSFAKQQETVLNKLKQDLEAKIADEKKKAGKKPDKTEKQRIAKLTRDAEAALRNEINKVSKNADQLKINLVLDFRKEIEPVTRRVAQGRGMSVVMIRNNSMLYIDPQADITNAVIDELQRLAPAKTDEPPAAGKTEEVKAQD